MSASGSGRAAIVELLVKAGADINVANKVSSGTSWGLFYDYTKYIFYCFPSNLREFKLRLVFILVKEMSIIAAGPAQTF